MSIEDCIRRYHKELKVMELKAEARQMASEGYTEQEIRQFV